jgi:hypothetical protein
LRVALDRRAGQPGQRLAGEVVLGRTEAAGGDDDVGTRARVGQDRRDALQVVANDGGLLDVDTDGGQLVP